MHEWCAAPYEVEIEKYMKQKECRHYFMFESPQLGYRSDLVDWLRCVADKYKLCTVTVHLAVFLMDRFMDHHSICESKLCAIGLVCLLIAAKFEERDNRLNEVKEVLNCNFREGLVTLEHLVLSWFDWTINFPTAGHFAEHYMRHAVLPSDKNPTRMSEHGLRQTVIGSLMDYLNMSLKAMPLLVVRGSAVAACCLLAARRRHCLSPSWPPPLASITGYTRSQLAEPLRILLKYEVVSEDCARRKRCGDSLVGFGHLRVLDVPPPAKKKKRRHDSAQKFPFRLVEDRRETWGWGWR